MIKRWSKLKRWKKWLLGTSFVVFVILVSIFLYFYYQIKTVDLDAIIAKHQESVGSSETEKSGNEIEKFPDYLSKPLDSANSLTDKPIKVDDAIDVATILMSSGLSMKEMSYLTGSSTEKLSVEEKQKIRDLLLKKLTSKEVEALRSITSEYGKNLVILDPNYPIELVGVYDENERQKIIAELNTKAQKKVSDTTENVSNSSKSFVKKKENNMVESTPEQQAAKQRIDNKYETELASLQRSCQAKVSDVTAQVQAYIKKHRSEGQEITLSDLQQNFLDEVSIAESQCDQNFDIIYKAMAADYSKEKLDASGPADLKATYQNSKNQARSVALTQIITSWKSKS